MTWNAYLNMKLKHPELFGNDYGQFVEESGKKLDGYEMWEANIIKSKAYEIFGYDS